MKLIELDLTKGELQGGRCHAHPDIVPREQSYLVQYDGRLYAGKFSVQHYGLNFESVYMSGVQYDKPGTNESCWERVWAVVEESEDVRVNQVFDAARRMRESEREARRRREEAEETEEDDEV